jgi:phosphoglycerate dehydrogenase-like enzyme
MAGYREAPEPVSQRPGWSKPRRVLVWNVAAEQVPALQAAAPDVELLLARDAKDAVALAGPADAAIGFCFPALFEAGRGIRWVQTYTAGVEDCVAVPALHERGVLVTNMQRVAGPVMAEHVVAMMLAFARGLDFFIPERLQGRWTTQVPPPSRMTTLEGKTVLVVGLGGIGTEVARRTHAFGMNVDAVRASGREGPDFVREVGLPADLPRLAARADYVVNTTPLTPETRGLYDAKFFDTVKRGAYFFNVGRGESVVQSALVGALRDGRLAGAGLDVTHPEPLPASDPLWRLPNVILTPHVSASSESIDDAAFAVVRENLRRYVAGERMLSVVDLARGY